MAIKILLIGGARPNFMKIAPLIKQLDSENIVYKLVHTGQHYDYNMSRIFFEKLEIPEPDYFLNAGSGSHAYQTGKIMIEFEKVVLQEKPNLVIVVGDVNSTIACALVAKKMFIDVIHIEAGLRSNDMNMPEEINRILTDQISDILFTTEPSAEINLKREGITSDKIFFVGNIMIDTIVLNIDKARVLESYKKYNLDRKNYALITLHRPSNVDNIKDLLKIIEILNLLQKEIKYIFPIHPRTKRNLIESKLWDKIQKNSAELIEPIGYLEFLNLMLNSKLILTDSGGIQEEASYLKIPVLTIRKNTERPITIERGTNTLIGTDINEFKKNFEKILLNDYKKGYDIDKWDGKTAIRIVNVLKLKYNL